MARPDHPLAQARRDAGLTQQQLAEKAGVAIRTVTNAESGCSPHRLTQRALAAGVSKAPAELWPQDRRAA